MRNEYLMDRIPKNEYFDKSLHQDEWEERISKLSENLNIGYATFDHDTINYDHIRFDSIGIEIRFFDLLKRNSTNFNASLPAKVS